MALRTHKVTRTAIDNLVWTPIVAPFKGRKVAWYSNGGNDTDVRDDALDSGTEKRLPSNSQESLALDRAYETNETVWFARSTVATDVVVATWVHIQG